MAYPELDIKSMRAQVGAIATLLRVLANQDRLLLMLQLRRGEACVGELEHLLGIHQPTLSQQLSVLRAKGLVSTRREGKNIFYRISDRRAVTVLETLCGVVGLSPDAAGSGGGNELAA